MEFATQNLLCRGSNPWREWPAGEKKLHFLGIALHANCYGILVFWIVNLRNRNVMDAFINKDRVSHVSGGAMNKSYQLAIKLDLLWVICESGEGELNGQIVLHRIGNHSMRRRNISPCRSRKCNFLSTDFGSLREHQCLISLHLCSSCWCNLPKFEHFCIYLQIFISLFT